MGITLAIFSLAIQCVLLCCVNVARKVPVNYILLSTFTFCFTFVVCFITSFYTANSVIMAAAMTAVMTATVTLYAVFTKTDFTVCGSLLYILTAGLFMLVLFSLFVTFPAWWEPVLSTILVVLYGIYLVYDVQIVVGGKRFELTLDDYVVGALRIYIDIVSIFLELLKLFGNRN